MAMWPHILQAISKWIEDGHGSCPMCRKLLVDPSSQPAGPSSSGSRLTDHDSDMILDEIWRLRRMQAEQTSILPELVLDDSSDNDRHQYVGMYS